MRDGGENGGRGEGGELIPRKRGEGDWREGGEWQKDGVWGEGKDGISLCYQPTPPIASK